MTRLRRLGGKIAARARARLLARGDVTVGAGTRFGPGVTCVAAPGGRIVLGAGVEVGAGASLVAGPGARLTLGEDVFVGGGSTIAASGRVSVGAGCMLADLVFIRDHDHDPAFPPRDGRMLQADVAVGERVWIAAKASVGRGVTIGDDAVVAAHAFVNRDVPADCLVAGVPASVVRDGVRAR